MATDPALVHPTGAANMPDPGVIDESVGFWTGNPHPTDVLRRGYTNLRSQYGINEIMRGRGGEAVNILGAFGSGGLPLAGWNLNKLLLNQGKTDPGMLNMMLARTGREGEANQAALRDRLARAGLGQSGIGQATQAAADASGQNRIAGIRANDLAASEERKRGDISLAESFYTDPLMQALGIERGVTTQGNALQAAQGNQKMQMYAAILGALAGCWVAREIYGERNPKWLRARFYIFTMASAALRNAYLANGPALAARVRRDPALRAKLTPVFDWMVEQAG